MHRFDRRSLKIRIVSAAVLIPVTLWVIWSGKHIFTAFCLIGAAICFYELRQMALKLRRPLVLQFFGLFYIALAGVCFYALRAQFSFQATMACIVLVWASDIGAYFVGKLIGGPKMAVRISPNKTWAGFAGALATPGLVAVIWAVVHDVIYPGYFAGHTKLDFVLVYLFCFMTGALIGVVGQAGDLMISQIKRWAKVKDSGALIPGHGGLLDRIDSLLPNIPVFYAIALAVRYAIG